MVFVLLKPSHPRINLSLYAHLLPSLWILIAFSLARVPDEILITSQVGGSLGKAGALFQPGLRLLGTGDSSPPPPGLRHCGL